MVKRGEPGKYRAKQLLVLQKTGQFYGPGQIVKLEEPAFIEYALNAGLIEVIQTTEESQPQTEQED